MSDMTEACADVTGITDIIMTTKDTDLNAGSEQNMQRGSSSKETVEDAVFVQEVHILASPLLAHVVGKLVQQIHCRCWTRCRMQLTQNNEASSYLSSASDESNANRSCASLFSKNRVSDRKSSLIPLSVADK